MIVNIKHKHFANTTAGVYSVEMDEKILRSFAWNDYDKNHSRDKAYHDAELFYSGVMSCININRISTVY